MGLIRSLKFRRTTLIIVGLAALLAGLGFARLWQLPDYLLVSLVAILAVVIFRNKKIAGLIAIIICGFVLGWARGTTVMQRLDNYNNYYGHNITVTGVATSDGTYSTGTQLAFDLGSLRVTSPAKAKLIGTIKVKGYGENAIYRGDKVAVSGKLYAVRGAAQGGLSFATVSLISRSSSPIEHLRLRFDAGMQSALPEPLASFGLGLLIGQRATLPVAVSNQLVIVGLTHLIAVSGYNLTILVNFARRVSGKRSKYQSTLISVLLMGFFLLFAGPSASIIRAIIVSGLSLAAWYYGRSIRPLLLILLAAVITAGWNPLYLWSDIGWYLSFLAFYGILIIAPLLTKRIFKKKTPPVLTALFIESLSAQIMTMPIILYIFSQVSIIGLVANVLVLPLVPIAMLFSAVAGVAGTYIPAVSGWFAWPARLLLTYMLDIVSLFSRVPHALVQRSLSGPLMVAMYGFVILLSFVLWHKAESKNDILTDIDEEF